MKRQRRPYSRAAEHFIDALMTETDAQNARRWAETADGLLRDSGVFGAPRSGRNYDVRGRTPHDFPHGYCVVTKNRDLECELA